MSKLSGNGIPNIGAAYVRVSTDDQTELSPDAQLRVILDAAKDDGIIIPKDYIFVESRGISGRKALNRPEFQRMISIAKSRQPAPFQRLYLWKFSRFARNQEESTFYKGILRKKCGVEIKSVSEPIAEGMFGRLIETIIEWFDEYYSVNLSGEVLRGMTEKALREGYQLSPCLGYQAAGNGKPFLVDQEQMQIAEYIHEAYHSGMDMTSIAREANRRGYRTNRGNPLERRTVERVLTNRFYVGDVAWNGITFRGTHEINPRISEVFEKNLERYNREYKPLRRRDVSAAGHWLSGLLKCGVCGASMSMNKSSTGGFFQCWKYAKGMHPGSNTLSVRKAEAAVLLSLRQVIEKGQLEYEHSKKTNEKAMAEEVRLTDALKRAECKEMRIKEAYEGGIDTLEEYGSNKQRLQRERDSLQAELNHLRAAARPDGLPFLGKEDILDTIQTVYDLISDPRVDYETKGNALRQVVRQIIYNRQSGEFKVFYYI